jgi:hypothetical protein
MDVVDVALRVTEALERCGIGYFLGGSLASSFHGEPRATNDVDLVVDLSEADVPRLLAALGKDFDGDEAALREAVRERGCWNAIYVPAVTKIDLFVRGTSAFDSSEFGRGRRVEVRPGKTLVVKSADDTVLRKLIWYREAGTPSERQWRDVVEVLRQSRGVLENGYLEAWAAALGITDLLTQARAEAAR